MTSRIFTRRCSFLIRFVLLATVPFAAGTVRSKTVSARPDHYSVTRDDAAGRLKLSAPYYTVEHDLKQGGAIVAIHLTHGRAVNQLLRPLETRIQDEGGVAFSDLQDPGARVSHRSDGLVEIVTVEGKLLNADGRAGSVALKSVFEYHWGYIKIHKEFSNLSDPVRVREVCLLDTELAPSFTDYGYREGTTEQEGAPPFAFGSNRWGKLERRIPSCSQPRSRVRCSWPIRELRAWNGSSAPISHNGTCSSPAAAARAGSSCSESGPPRAGVLDLAFSEHQHGRSAPESVRHSTTTSACLCSRDTR